MTFGINDVLIHFIFFLDEELKLLICIGYVIMYPIFKPYIATCIQLMDFDISGVLVLFLVHYS